MSDDKASPRPWRAVDRFDDADVLDANGDSVAIGGGDSEWIDRADAALIVRAVNAHAALVAACKAALKANARDGGTDAADLGAQLEAALALAEEK